jgi:hypothetical protein
MLHMSGINPVLVHRLAQEQLLHQQGNLSAPLLVLQKTEHVFHALNASLQSRPVSCTPVLRCPLGMCWCGTCAS